MSIQKIFVITLGVIAVVGISFSALAKDNSEKLNIQESILEEAENVECGRFSVADLDGNVYRTVKIGAQCWMKENLRTKYKPDGTLLSNLKDGSERDCIAQGDVRGSEKDCSAGRALYTWNAALNTETDDPQEGAQGICPTGWHIPTDSEWYDLELSLSADSNVCNPSREDWGCSPAGDMLMSSPTVGFNAMLSGWRNSSSFAENGTRGMFWSSSDVRLSRSVSAVRKDVERMHNLEDVSFSVRCIKNL